MRHVFLALTLCFAAAPALSQSTEPKGPTAPDAPLFEGLDDLTEGMRKLLEGIQDDVAPLMEDLGDQLRGLSAYHPPEVLPNGDIIIRRKTPAEMTPEDDSAIDI